MFADTLQASFNISIHALRKESDASWPHYLTVTVISIHALRKESDYGATPVQIFLFISIHALRKESDLRQLRHVPRAQYFNPRSP